LISTNFSGSCSILAKAQNCTNSFRVLVSILDSRPQPEIVSVPGIVQGGEDCQPSVLADAGARSLIGCQPMGCAATCNLHS
jgi:hypothetical protein